MTFDPSTAQPLNRFDPSTATRFDPSSATLSEPPKLNFWENVEGSFGSFGRGALGPWVDEVAGGLGVVKNVGKEAKDLVDKGWNAALEDVRETYDKSRSSYEEVQREWDQKYGGMTQGGEFWSWDTLLGGAGLASSLLVPFGWLGKAGKAAQGASMLEKAVGTVLKGAAIGTAWYSGFMFGEGETLNERLHSAFNINTLIYGTGGGVLLGILGPMAGHVGRYLPEIKILGVKVTGTSPKAWALDYVRRALGRDGVTEQEAETWLRQQGTSLSDLGQSAVVSASKQAALTGPGRSLAASLYQGERLGGREQRVGKAIDTFVSEKSMYDTIDSLSLHRAAAARPLYEKAFSSNAPVTSERIQQFMKDPLIQAGLKQGLEIQRIEALAVGQKFDPALYKVDKDGNLTGQPTLRTLDALKRGLDEMLEGYRDPTTGIMRLDQKGHALRQLREALVGEIDRVAPAAYKAARQAWAGPTQMIDMVWRGRKFMREDPEILERMLADASEGDREAFLIGAARAMADIAASGEHGATQLARKMVGSSAMQERLKVILRDPKAYDELMQVFQRELQWQKRGAQILGGSDTAMKLEESGEFNADQVLDDIVELVRYPATGILKMGRNGMGRAIQNRLIRMSDQRRQEVARLLFSTNREDNLAAIREIFAPTRRGTGGVIKEADDQS